ncbi:MAG: TIGR03086 family protein [Actinobacteria bacterium]|nr:TIGR03086 family protein [Actinomycetota bacterium]
MDSDTFLATDPRPALAQALDTTGAVLAAVTPADLDAPTPCTTMNVRELVDHLLMAGSRIASAARGDELSAWAITGPDLPFEAWGDAWQTVADAARAEWAADDERLDRPTQLPWATVAGRQAAAVYANELLVHAWDLAAAIDARPEWDDDAIEVASASIHLELPDADRGPMWAAMAEQMPPGVPWEDPFANAVEVADQASAIERLVAWNGRDPHWTRP